MSLVTPIDDALLARSESWTAADTLRFAAEAFGDRVALASSFGAEDVVVCDLIARHAPAIAIFTLDTGRLHEETYEVMEQIRRRYGLRITSYFPDSAAVERLEREKGFYSFRESLENRKECCRIRKVEPLGRALAGLEAWITGLRREQAVTRTQVPKLQPDESHPGIWKLNPLADWTEAQVWEHIREHKVPVNALHQQGYPSIGCSPCTRAVQPGEDIRAGRWWWKNPEQKECGLHAAKH